MSRWADSDWRWSGLAVLLPALPCLLAHLAARCRDGRCTSHFENSHSEASPPTTASQDKAKGGEQPCCSPLAPPPLPAAQLQGQVAAGSGAGAAVPFKGFQ